MKNMIGALCGIMLLGFLGGCGGGGGGGSIGPGSGNAAITLVSLQVTPSNQSIALGTNQQFTATGIFSDSTVQDLTAQVTWSSSDTGRVTISNVAGSNGMANAVAAGAVTISAQAGNVTGSAALTVKPAAVTLVSIGVTPAAPSIAAGTQQQFTATGVFSDSSVQDLTTQVSWSSSNQSLATISNTAGSKGLASAAALVASTGSTTITASLTISGTTVSGSTTLTVTTASLVSVEVTPAAPGIAKGLTQQFKATGIFTDNSKQDLTAYVTWSSSNNTVATIGTNGVATGVGAGTSTVTAAFGGKSASTTLTVTAATLTAIEVSPLNPSIALGNSQQFTAIGRFTDNTTQNLTTAVTWSSSAAGVATISNATGFNGLATSAASGPTTITATLSGVSGSTLLTVTNATLVLIDVEPALPTLPAGVPQQFTATGTFSDGTTEDLTTAVTWSSSDAAAATISNAAGSNGLLVTGTAGTTATITATFGAVSGSTVLSVTTATLQSIEVDPADTSIPQGLPQQLTATGIYSDNSVVDLTQVVTWSSSAATVATVSNDPASAGLAASLAPGTATITATLGTVSGTTTLTVTQAKLVSIAITPASANIAIGTTLQFVATGTYDNHTTQDITQSVTWTSAVATVASISNVNTQKGLATAVGVGSTGISAALGSVVSPSVPLAVTNAVLQSITITPANATIAIKTSQQFVATGNFDNGTTQALTRQVTWRSANTAVATISNATSTKGVATGANLAASSSTTISAILAIAGKTVTGSTSLTVTPATLTSIVVMPANPTIVVGATQQFTAMGVYNNGAFQQDLTKAVKWNSSKKNIAPTNNGFANRGLATGRGSGSTTISATKQSTGVTGSTTLTVQ